MNGNITKMPKKQNLEQLKRENILHRWQLSAKELTLIVDENPSMRGLMLGYVAEYKLKKLYFESPRISALVKDDDHDRRKKGDIRLIYRGKSFLVESKSLQSNTIRQTDEGFAARFQCDASDCRTVKFSDGSEVRTTCLLAGEFDIVAVNLFALGQEWRFGFALNTDLPRSRYRNYNAFQQNQLIASLIGITYPLQPPFVDDPFLLLDRLIDGA